LKFVSKKRLLVLLIIGTALSPLIFTSDVFAGEGSSSGRKIYDNVMLFVNFGILVFLFIKYGKTPMMKYFIGVRGKLAKEFDTINGQKEDTKSLRDAEAEKLKDVEKNVEEIKQNILQIGEREKETIIEEGRLSAEKMVHDAENYAKYAIQKAQKALSDKMVDMAIDMVKEKLTRGVTEEDNETLVEKFVIDIKGQPAQVNRVTS